MLVNQAVHGYLVEESYTANYSIWTCKAFFWVADILWMQTSACAVKFNIALATENGATQNGQDIT